MAEIQWGNVAEWVGGVGVILTVAVALGIAIYGNRAVRSEREAERAQQMRDRLLGHLADFAEASSAAATRAEMLVAFEKLRRADPTSRYGARGMMLELERETARVERSRRSLRALGLSRILPDSIPIDRTTEPVPRYREADPWKYFGPNLDAAIPNASKGQVRSLFEDLGVWFRVRESFALDVLELLDHEDSTNGAASPE